MTTDERRAKILELIDQGEITVEEGARQLQELVSGKKPETAAENDRMNILNMIDSGEISAQEGLDRLASHDAAQETPAADAPPSAERSTPPIPADINIDGWRRVWMVPLWIGVGVTVISGGWMLSAYQSSGTGFWFFCTWLPLLIGAGLMALAWSSRSSRWLHVRIKGRKGRTSQNVAISIPLPIRFTAWVVRTFGDFIPQLEGTSVDEIILALENSTSTETPFYVNVQEGEDGGDGESVEVFIG